MLFSIAILITAAALGAPGQANGGPRPLVQLIQDLDAAVTRAHLSDAQRSQLQSDRAVLETARVAKEQGRAIDRHQVAGAVKNIHSVIERGAFLSEDQQTLNADIDDLRKQ